MAGMGLVGAMFLGQAMPAAAVTGAQSLLVVGVNDRLTVVAAGPVAGVGDITPIDDENDLISLPNGTVHLHHPQTGGDFDLDPRTCVATATFTGTYTLSGGTGAYMGVSGTGTFAGRGIFRFGRSSDGSCSEEEEVFRFFTVRNTGTTSLP